MAGANWSEILATDPELDFEGIDLDKILTKLGALTRERRAELVAAINLEKAKVETRGDIVDSAFDLFLGALDIIT